MNKPPLISICIPAYKRLDFLKRLLDSISIQTFKDFEVIITDDSPGNDVEEFCKLYSQKFAIIYKKNTEQLGTPQNWNEAINLANGKWIKLMHDDDWFATAESLNVFQMAISNHPKANFFFSDYCNHYLEKGTIENVHPSSFRKKILKGNPVTLVSKNIIGPPSVTLYRNVQGITYDRNTRWVVDIDFYIQYLKDHEWFHIHQVLINVGIGAEQVTQDCFRKREIEIPENFYLLNKTGVHNLRNIFVFDAWWRLLRNLEVRKVDDIETAGYNGVVPEVIQSMINWQSKIPLSILKIGIISKSIMLINYFFNYNRVPA